MPPLPHSPQQNDERTWLDDERVGASLYEVLFAAAPGPYLVLRADRPRFTIIAVNNAYLRATMTTRAAILGQRMFDVFPDPPEATHATGTRNLRASLERALSAGVPDHMAVQRYDIRRPHGSWEERYWLPVNTPVRDDDGTVRWIIHHVEDVTAAVHTQHDLRASEARLAVALVEAQGSRDRLERLARLSEALASTENTADVARLIVEAGVDALSAQLGSLGLLSDDACTFELVATVGMTDGDLQRWARFPNSGEIPWVHAVATREPVFVTSPEEFSRFPDLGDTPARLGLAAEYAIPLLSSRDGVLGVVGFSFAADRPLMADDRRLVDTYARQCAQAMERALLHRAELAARNELDAANARLRDHALALERSNRLLLQNAREMELAAAELSTQRDAADDMRRMAEGAERRVSSILESVTDAFYVVDHEWRLIYVNRRAEELWGRARTELLGRQLWDCFPDAVGGESHRQLQSAMRERRSASFEAHAVTLDRWIRVHAYPTPEGLSVYFTDISAEREIATERARHVTLAELLQRVAVAANAAPSLETALNAAVETVCTMMHWPVGHAYVTSRGMPSLVSSRVWRLEQPECCSALRKASERLSIKPGVCLIGRAYAARRSVWVANVAEAPWFQRAAEAAAAGLATALAIPVLADDQVAGVMEFFSPGPVVLDDAYLRVMDQVGAQLGRVIEREWAGDDRRLLLQRIVAAQEEERRRLSRDVHDNLGQHLTAMQLQLRALRGLANIAPEVDQRLAGIEALADTLHTDARALAFALRPTVLDDVGLASALADYAARWSAHTGVSVDLSAEALDVERLPPEVETALYRVVQEALTNVARHAAASQVSLVLQRRNGHVLALIEDDGRGFDPDDLQRIPTEQRRLGLLGMQERVAAVGGTLSVQSSPGSGTRLAIQTPLPPARGMS